MSVTKAMLCGWCIGLVGGFVGFQLFDGETTQNLAATLVASLVTLPVFLFVGNYADNQKKSQ